MSTNDIVFDKGTKDKFMASNDYLEVSSRNKKVWLVESEFLNTYKTSETKGQRLTFIRSIDDLVTGKKIGYVILEIREGVLNSLLDDINLGEGDRIILVAQDHKEMTANDIDHQNYIVGTSDYEKILQSVDKLGQWQVKLNNSQYKMFYHYVGDLGTVIIGMLPNSTMLAAANEIKSFSILMVATAVLIVMVVGAVIIRNINANIENIVSQVKQAATGDFTANIKSKRYDEFGILGESFNQMLESIRRLIGENRLIADQITHAGIDLIKANDCVGQSSMQVACATEKIETGADGQSHQAEVCLKEMKTLAERIEHVAMATASTQEMSQKVIQMTTEGIEVASNLSEKAGRTSEITGEITQSIHALNTKVKSIYVVIDLIKSLAKETNLLSLNARIEAAGAGMYGKGFAVVAERVKQMSEESTLAANEITKIIDDIMMQSCQVVNYASVARETLSVQDKAVKETLETFETISAYIEEFIEAINDITTQFKAIELTKDTTLQAVCHITEVAEDNVEISNQINTLVDEQKLEIDKMMQCQKELEILSISLSEAISLFKIK